MSDPPAAPWTGPPGASVHGILQARILEWAAISYPRGSSQPREPLHCRGVLYHWATHTYTTHILEAPGLAHKKRLPSLGSRATCPILWEPAWIKTRGSKSRTGGPAGGVSCTPPRMSPRRAGCPWIRSPRLLSAPQCRNRAHPRMWWSALYAHVQQWRWLYGSFVCGEEERSGLQTFRNRDPELVIRLLPYRGNRFPLQQWDRLHPDEMPSEAERSSLLSVSEDLNLQARV